MLAFDYVYLWDSMLIEHQTCDQKVLSVSPGRKDRRIFFSRVNFVH